MAPCYASRGARFTLVLRKRLSQFAEIAKNQPELLARHYTQAGRFEIAAGFWGKAGMRSLDRSALVEAAEQLTQALAQNAAFPTTPALRREQIKLQVAFATTLFHVKGYTRPETIAAFEQADAMMEHAESLGDEPPAGEDAPLRFSVMYGQWTGNFTAGNFVRAAELAKQFLAVAEKQARSAPLLMAHQVMGANLAVMGNFHDARLHLDRAVALYVPEEHKGLATKFGQDSVAALGYQSLALYRLGYPESALRDGDLALKSAGDLGLAGTIGYAAFMTGILEALCGRFAIAEARVDELFALSEKHGLAQLKAVSGLLRGWIFAATDRTDEAAKLIDLSKSAVWASGAKYFAPYSLACLARAHAACGRPTEAKNAISEAFDVMSETSEKWDEAEIHRAAGEIALSFPHVVQKTAEAHFQESLAVARRQAAKSCELRAATSLARLWRDQGRPGEAVELLTPIFAWFTEGFDLRDLKEAKALLDDLQGSSTIS